MGCKYLLVCFGRETDSELVWVLVGIAGFTLGWFIPHRDFLANADPELPEAHSIED